ARLLVTTKSDATFVHLFEAEITPKLLAILDNLTLSLDHVLWPVIKHSRIPFCPYISLRERLIAHLLDVQNAPPGEPTMAKLMATPSNKRRLEEASDSSRRARIKG
ncbi:hypothetical protein ACHAPT_000571, partial [Fusarium lateritium]